MLIQIPVFLPSQVRYKVLEGGWVFGSVKTSLSFGSFDPSISRVHALDLKLPFNDNHEAYSLRDNAGIRLQLKEEAKWIGLLWLMKITDGNTFFSVDLLGF